MSRTQAARRRELYVPSGTASIKYVPVAEVDYNDICLIGVEDPIKQKVYLLMNYNPNPLGGSKYYWTQRVGSRTYMYAYGIEGVRDETGAVVAVDTSRYPDATLTHTEWRWDIGGIASEYSPNMWLTISYNNWGSYDLYPSSTIKAWSYDVAASTLKGSATSERQAYLFAVVRENTTPSIVFTASKNVDEWRTTVKFYKKVQQ